MKKVNQMHQAMFAALKQIADGKKLSEFTCSDGVETHFDGTGTMLYLGDGNLNAFVFERHPQTGRPFASFGPFEDMEGDSISHDFSSVEAAARWTSRIL